MCWLLTEVIESLRFKFPFLLSIRNGFRTREKGVFLLRLNIEIGDFIVLVDFLAELEIDFLIHGLFICFFTFRAIGVENRYRLESFLNALTGVEDSLIILLLDFTRYT